MSEPNNEHIASPREGGVLMESEPVVIHFMGGGIEVDAAPAGVNLYTGGGSIHVGSVHGSAVVKTMGGDIEIDSATGPVSASTMAGAITVHFHASSSGQPVDIDLSSNSGDITLTVPKEFSMTIEVCLSCTENHRGQFQIAGNLALHGEESALDHFRGSPRRYLRAGRTFGDGHNRVTINTINGNVSVIGR